MSTSVRILYMLISLYIYIFCSIYRVYWRVKYTHRVYLKKFKELEVETLERSVNFITVLHLLSKKYWKWCASTIVQLYINLWTTEWQSIHGILWHRTVLPAIDDKNYFLVIK